VNCAFFSGSLVERDKEIGRPAESACSTGWCATIAQTTTGRFPLVIGGEGSSKGNNNKTKNKHQKTSVQEHPFFLGCI
jgi:hypothetical protein